MNNNEKENAENDKPDDKSSQAIPKVSKVIVDEEKGTVTLILASEEEIAQANEQSAKKNEQ